MIIERKKKEVPLIRTHGSACDRTKKDILRSLIVFSVVAFTLLAFLNVSRVQVLSNVEVPAPTVVLHDHNAPHATRADRSPPRKVAATLLTEEERDDECFTDRMLLIADIGLRISNMDLSRSAPPPHSTKQLLDSIMDMLSKDKCLRVHRRLLAGEPRGNIPKFFFDLGSRMMDQTQNFLKHFPDAPSFRILCYEANGKFATTYSSFLESHPETKLVFRHAAVGVHNTTMVLSDRSVGSSIVRESGYKPQDGDVVVPVVDFAKEFFEVVTNDEESISRLVVVKMDIEKMEFAVLHRFLYTHALLFVDDLLLECHYNTNKARSERDPTIHIGLDDCVTLVQRLNEVLGTRFEAVLWNSAKTAKTSGYTARHGGFRPT